MRNETKKIMSDLYDCVDYMREKVERVEEALANNNITTQEANAKIRWFWYQTFDRLMDESFSHNMPAPDWRKKGN